MSRMCKPSSLYNQCSSYIILISLHKKVPHNRGEIGQICVNVGRNYHGDVNVSTLAHKQLKGRSESCDRVRHTSHSMVHPAVIST